MFFAAFQNNLNTYFMARKENKSRSEKISKSKVKESMKERENDLESGDNPDERERISGNVRR
jgi:hypothetical protein